MGANYQFKKILARRPNTQLRTAMHRENKKHSEERKPSKSRLSILWEQNHDYRHNQGACYLGSPIFRFPALTGFRDESLYRRQTDGQTGDKPNVATAAPHNKSVT